MGTTLPRRSKSFLSQFYRDALPSRIISFIILHIYFLINQYNLWCICILSLFFLILQYVLTLPYSSLTSTLIHSTLSHPFFLSSCVLIILRLLLFLWSFAVLFLTPSHLSYQLLSLVYNFHFCYFQSAVKCFITFRSRFSLLVLAHSTYLTQFILLLSYATSYVLHIFISLSFSFYTLLFLGVYFSLTPLSSYNPAFIHACPVLP